jgi:hypothetical protein
MDETHPGILAIRRKAPDSDEIEVILVRAEQGAKVDVLDLGPYKTSLKAQRVILELGPPDHFDGRTAEMMWIPDVEKIRRMLGIH